MSRSKAPSLRTERTLLRGGYASLACSDEVGRGALCGPVTVGMVLITEETRTAPQGVRDSKLLSPEARRRLVPKIQRWAPSYGIGHASPAEIDEFGVIVALRLAGHRALAQLTAEPGAVLLDGNHDYLTPPEQLSMLEPPRILDAVPPVVTMIKADLRCAAVAAASILAKTARDEIMVGLAEECPDYGWADNKGYSAPEHIAALARLGPTRHHRVSWSLPGLDDTTVHTVHDGGQNVADMLEEAR
ncbi:MAG TPA: ribonuclease HII [Marmoricola sp.]